jgi:hypothetical protein
MYGKYSTYVLLHTFKKYIHLVTQSLLTFLSHSQPLYRKNNQKWVEERERGLFNPLVTIILLENSSTILYILMNPMFVCGNNVSFLLDLIWQCRSCTV